SNEKDKEYKYRITPPTKKGEVYSFRVTPYVNCEGKPVWGKATRGIEIKPADSGGLLIRHFDIEPEQVKGGKPAEGKADLNKPAPRHPQSPHPGGPSWSSGCRGAR